eukprot:scaffold681533_cov71-Prasinocladus_malaysianus.AAC.1
MQAGAGGDKCHPAEAPQCCEEGKGHRGGAASPGRQGAGAGGGTEWIRGSCRGWSPEGVCGGVQREAEKR